jgi:hypothetical protein
MIGGSSSLSGRYLNLARDPIIPTSGRLSKLWIPAALMLRSGLSMQ